jgi:hypothetical protein
MFKSTIGRAVLLSSAFGRNSFGVQLDKLSALEVAMLAWAPTNLVESVAGNRLGSFGSEDEKPGNR